MTSTTPAETGLTVLQMARDGRFAEIREMFAEPLRPMVTAEALQAVWEAEVDRHGSVTSVGEPVSETAATGETAVRIPVTFERGELTVIVAMAGEVLVGIQLAPASAAAPMKPWEPPAYVDAAAFDEQEVTVGSGPLAVPGTLSVPRRPGAGPAVVLLTGSGPHDRDETIGRNKPFKDLAWGLASHGVTVLRYDKVTHVHARESAKNPDFTLADEYVTHAVAAVSLLREHSSVDPARIFVLGHSQGGTAAPRVAAAEPRVAGLVVMAGGTQALQWAAVRQFRYIASLDPRTAAGLQPTIEVMTRQAQVVDGPDLSASTPQADLPFGVPATYWLDLRAYEPAAVAAEVGKPMLILQGARDYQVTVADDLTGWQAALADRPNVTIRVYDADNHLFFPGTGPSSPAEYEPAQHMDPAVVADIADWLTHSGWMGH